MKNGSSEVQNQQNNKDKLLSFKLEKKENKCELYKHINPSLRAEGIQNCLAPHHVHTCPHIHTPHHGKKGNLILPLWFDGSNCSNDSSVVLWVLWMSPEPVISPVGTRGWERMLLQPTKWPLNHRLWSHSGLWKSVHLLLNVSGRVCALPTVCIVSFMSVRTSGHCLEKKRTAARLRCWSAPCVRENCMAAQPVKCKLCVYKFCGCKWREANVFCSQMLAFNTLSIVNLPHIIVWTVMYLHAVKFDSSWVGGYVMKWICLQCGCCTYCKCLCMYLFDTGDVCRFNSLYELLCVIMMTWLLFSYRRGLGKWCRPLTY